MSVKARYKAGVQYIGTSYSGFAKNDCEWKPSVLQMIETSLVQFCNQKATYENLRGSSRTDSGVHALRNVFHFDLERLPEVGKLDNHQSQPFDPLKVKNGMNYYLDAKEKGIVITDVQMVPSTFHCQFNAKARTYMYRIIYQSDSATSFETSNSFLFRFHDHRAWYIYKKLNIQSIYRASRDLLGTHDFASFKMSGCVATTTIKTILGLNIYLNGHYLKDISDIKKFEIPFSSSRLNLMDGTLNELVIEIKTNSFIMRMVRNLVALLIQIGMERKPENELKRLLEVKNRDQFNLVAAPPEGLYLVNVHYEDYINNPVILPYRKTIDPEFTLN